MEKLDHKNDMAARIAELEAINSELLAACEAAMRIKSLWLPEYEPMVTAPAEHMVLAKMADKFTAAIEKATQPIEDK